MCWKAMDSRFRFWLPWSLLVAGLLLYGYYRLLVAENCQKLGCAVQFAAVPAEVPAGQFKPLYNDQRRIAVCLVGGARMFELTGRTLRKYLLDVYNNTDVFLHSPLDKDSHKFILLAGRNLRAAKIFIPQPIPETKIMHEVITSWGSPHGMQGLLQYFNLVEGCYGMVKKFEVQHKIKYDWIIRTRVDGYWNAPVPDISLLDSNYYYVAAGSDFHGLNDRFGMGTSHTSRAANSRLSLLPLIHQRGFRGLNSESAYKAQLIVSGVQYQHIQLPFCIMTLRKEAYPPAPYGLLVVSMNMTGPVSGTYCRPCDKEANKTVSAKIVDSTMRDWDWPGIPGRNVTVCDARTPWASNWRDIAGKVYGRDVPEDKILNSEDVIPNFGNRSLTQCIREIEEFQTQWDVWEAPLAVTICEYGMSKSL